MCNDFLNTQAIDTLDLCVAYIKNLFKPGSKIVVAMSGGIDSSFTAAIIKRAGFETIGVTLQLYRSPAIARGKTCCAGKDIQDAKNVANAENFPHYVLDYTALFKQKVIDNFIDTYEAGQTPIPCGRCNQYVKFGYMLDFAKSIEADYLVTGHYAQKMIVRDKLATHDSATAGQCNEEHMLLRGEDKHKDQSYFLALTTIEQLKMLHFPLAKIPKTLVRKFAAEIGLSVAKKPESMDICFIPDGDYRGFLKRLRPEMFKAGNIVSTCGDVLGKHEGLAIFTIGQRKNLGLNGGPWYVLELQTDSNTLLVGKENDLKKEKFLVAEINLLVQSEYFADREIEIQIRARHKPAVGKFDPATNIVSFASAQQAITPGQICAFYEGERLLGGAIIDRKIL